MSADVQYKHILRNWVFSSVCKWSSRYKGWLSQYLYYPSHKTKCLGVSVGLIRLELRGKEFLGHSGKLIFSFSNLILYLRRVGDFLECCHPSSSVEALHLAQPLWKSTETCLDSQHTDTHKCSGCHPLTLLTGLLRISLVLHWFAFVAPVQDIKKCLCSCFCWISRSECLEWGKIMLKKINFLRFIPE